MSNPDNFQDLQKLLSIKRREQPPRDFFTDLAGNVRTRLATEPADRPPTWRQRLGLEDDFKPALPLLFGLCFSSLVAVGLFFATRVEPTYRDPLASAPVSDPIAPDPVRATSAAPTLGLGATNRSMEPVLTISSPFPPVPPSTQTISYPPR